MYKVLSAKNLTGDLYEFKIYAPNVTKYGQAGQFTILRLDETGERLPLTIADLDKENDVLTIVFMAVGETTKQLASLKEGDYVLDIVGPLGIPTEVSGLYGNVAVVAGGYGAAPSYLIAKAYKDMGNKVYLILGARNKELLFWLDKMQGVCDELIVATNDGSYGYKGLVTDSLNDIMNKETLDLVMAIGPLPMMKAISDLTKPHEIKTIVSLNPIMVDGTGMCGACRVSVNRETKFACVDGPDFDGHLVDFQELMVRNKIYDEREHKCNIYKQANELESRT